MKSGKKSGKRRLSEEERHLWERVIGTTTPLHPQGRQNSISTESPATPTLHRQQKIASPPLLRGLTAKPPPPLPLTGLDRRTEQRLRRGRIDVDGTLDLHGMTQSHAHKALRRFLAAAQGRGDRLVLVITGKGSPRGPRMEPDLMWGSGRGVLRRLVPQWLSQADFSTWVSGFRDAHQRHGGGGAIYVRIRRKRV